MENVIQKGIEMIAANPAASQSILIALGIGLVLPVVIALIKRKYPAITKTQSYLLAYIFSFISALVSDMFVNHFNWALIVANLSLTFTTSQIIYHFVLELLGWKEKLEGTK